LYLTFLGEYSECKTFFHGHSYTGNQLGAAAALASLALLQSAKSVRARCQLEDALRLELTQLWETPIVGDIRQVGLIAGIELVRDWRRREAFDLRERAGIRVCAAMAKRGVLTRPMGNVIVLMPPYCTTAQQARRIVSTLGKRLRRHFLLAIAYALAIAAAVFRLSPLTAVWVGGAAGVVLWALNFLCFRFILGYPMMNEVPIAPLTRFWSDHGGGIRPCLCDAVVRENLRSHSQTREPDHEFCSRRCANAPIASVLVPV
jgi:hypothetical protein